ncbi:MAG: anti-phage dCTP deaminase [Enhygromyxa sp.]
MTADESSSADKHEADPGELVIGFVAPVGTDFDKVLKAVQRCLVAYGYQSEGYRLSDLFASDEIRHLIKPINAEDECLRIEGAMDAGDDLRRHTGVNEIMAFYAAARIQQVRKLKGGSSEPLPRTAHLLRSLKRPEEVAWLRKIYGSRFLLVSIFAPRDHRINFLGSSRGGAIDAARAMALIQRDGAGGAHGQATTRSFELGDLFLNGALGSQRLEIEIARFLDLVFGSPLHTPRREEHGMFLAFAASLRSGDLSRQVGAVIVADDGTLVAEGANDAPRFGGGQYWPNDDEDQRDIVVGRDSNEDKKREIVRRILAEFDALEPGVDPLKLAKRRLEDSGLLDITEFGRAVHAEMAALMNCARLGVPTKDRALFCTTFPCHNCAKHIVAAGISEVWFIEPYPKSQAANLYHDSITLEGKAGKLEFKPFVGIGPRRYVELFALRDAFGVKISRKDDSGSLVEWCPGDAMLVLPDRLITYLDQEVWASAQMSHVIERARGSTRA